MKQSRLDGFSDGIFAIILTLLAFDLKVPTVSRNVSDQGLWNSLTSVTPIFLSFILSFALIFTYWRAHHYIVSVYAKSIDHHLTNINALFFFFVSLIPFTTQLLGEYSTTKLSIVIYALNILAISFSLLWMRNYVLDSGHVEHVAVAPFEKVRGLIRIIVPMIFALVAMAVCFYSTWLALLLLTLAIVFNLFSRSPRLVNTIIEKTKEEILG